MATCGEFLELLSLDTPPGEDVGVAKSMWVSRQIEWGCQFTIRCLKVKLSMFQDTWMMQQMICLFILCIMGEDLIFTEGCFFAG